MLGRDMVSRERVERTLRHEPTDRIPFDLGATFATGIDAEALHRVRKSLGLEAKPVRVFDPYQMLGEVETDLLLRIGADCVGLWNRATLFGTRNLQWRSWDAIAGVPALVGSDFRCRREADGSLLAFPKGDASAAPCARLPAGGRYFDSLVRAEPMDEDRLDARSDFALDYAVLDDDELEWLHGESMRLFHDTDLAVVGVLTPASFNDLAHLPAPFLKRTPGPRSAEDFLVFHHTHPDYIHEMHRMHLEAALQNLALYREAVGDRISVIVMSGADYGTQRGLFLSRDMFREFVLPYQKAVNGWVHANTSWKTFYHSCGGISDILGDMIDAGCDIINPVQYSAAGMEPEDLQARFGRRVVFWGGIIDTQSHLVKQSPEEIRRLSERNLRILGSTHGCVAAATHNIQRDTPTGNILAFLETAGNPRMS